MKVLLAALVSLGLLVGALVGALVLWPKPILESAASFALGRPVEIGRLRVDWGGTPRIEADDLYVRSPEGSADDVALVQSSRLVVEIDAMALLGGSVHLPAIEASGTRLDLSTSAPGDAADEPDPSSGGPPPIPRIDTLQLESVEIVLARDGEEGPVTMKIEEATAERDGDDVALRASGTYADRPFEVDGRIDDPSTLREASEPYALDLRASFGATRVEMGGRIGDPVHLREFDLDVAVEGNDLSDVYDLAGLPLIPTPPFSLSGDLGRRGDVWKVQSLEGAIGDSRVTGSLSVDLSAERPHVRSHLQSPRLDLDDLAPLLGAPPDTGPGETASPAQQREAEAERSDGDVVPDEPLDLAPLRAADADFALDASDVRSEAVPVDALRLELQLRDGVLEVEELAIDIGTGSATAHGSLDARTTPVAVSAMASLERIPLARLMPSDELADETRGELRGGWDLDSTGTALDEILRDADGQLALFLSDGQVSHLLVELAGLDVFDALGFVLTGDQTLRVRCAVAAFEAKSGRFETKTLLLDTPDTRVDAEGELDFGNERVDLVLTPHPKDVSLLSLRSPIRIEGPIEEPSIYPDPLGLGPGPDYVEIASLALAPIVGAASPVDVGWAEGSDCAELLPLEP